jgi:DNA modification methylase
LVEVFREVRRVLADDGTMWLNLGDSYAGGGGYAQNAPCNQRRSAGDSWGAMNPFTVAQGEARTKAYPGMVPSGLKPKDLVGIPWMVAFALRADGWYLRSDIIWSKPNPMPESVTDRPTKAHEYMFLLSKSQKYYYDADAIRDAPTGRTDATWFTGKATAVSESMRGDIGRTFHKDGTVGANKRSVWHIATQPYPEAHFATFPEALIEPCILAGSALGDTVLDPFTGSGTTGAVAIRHQRSFVGCELNPAYVELARQRIGAVAPLFAQEVA